MFYVVAKWSYGQIGIPFFLTLIKGLYFIHCQIYLMNNNFELKGTSLSLAFEDFLDFVQSVLQTWAS